MSKQQQSKRFRIPWLTMASVLALIIQVALTYFGLKLPAPVINEIITVICGALAVAGIVTPKSDAEDDTLEGTTAESGEKDKERGD